MELAYLPDPMSRLGVWNTYPTWEDINSNNSLSKRPINPCREAKISEKNCSICQKKKKRALSDYIKSKQIDCQNSYSILEEDEEEANGHVEEGNKQRLS